MIVVGSQPGPKGEITPGTTGMRLLQGAPCAVAIPPIGLRERERLHHVGVAYDATEEARAALGLAYALAERDGTAASIYRALPRIGPAYGGAMGPELDAAALRIRNDAQGELDAAAELAPAGVNPQTVMVHDRPEAITGECNGIVDLLVMGSRGYGPLHRVFAGSSSQALILGAQQPVLIVPRASVALATAAVGG